MAIDRRNGAEVAMETVKLAEEFMLSSDGLVVGIDLSGDPTVSQPMFSNFNTATSNLNGTSFDQIGNDFMHFHHLTLAVKFSFNSLFPGWTWQRPASCSPEGQELRTETVTASLRGKTTTFLLRSFLMVT